MFPLGVRKNVERRRVGVEARAVTPVAATTTAAVIASPARSRMAADLRAAGQTSIAGSASRRDDLPPAWLGRRTAPRPACDEARRASALSQRLEHRLAAYGHEVEH